MTPAEAAKLPLTLDVDQFASLAGVGRSACYSAIKAGTFPLPVLRIGTRVKIPTKPALRLLGIEPEGGAS